jgi:sRNA-binding regulator protein Hfq
MSGQALLPTFTEPDLTQTSVEKHDFAGREETAPQSVPVASRRPQRQVTSTPVRLTAYDDQAPHHQAELFYLQKQIQSQTPMVIVMEDGETIEGCIEWYDRHALKVRGRTRMLLYKSAIKYMYKQGENGV